MPRQTLLLVLLLALAQRSSFATYLVKFELQNNTPSVGDLLVPATAAVADVDDYRRKGTLSFSGEAASLDISRLPGNTAGTQSGSVMEVVDADYVEAEGESLVAVPSCSASGSMGWMNIGNSGSISPTTSFADFAIGGSCDPANNSIGGSVPIAEQIIGSPSESYTMCGYYAVLDANDVEIFRSNTATVEASCDDYHNCSCSRAAKRRSKM